MVEDLAKEVTERQRGVVALRDLLFSYNIVFLGDEGLNKAYRDFMEKEGITLKPPTKKQEEYTKQLRRLGD